MAIDLNPTSVVCRKCGTAYSRLKGYFPVSYAVLYKGTGYIPYCRDCIDEMFNAYVAEGHSTAESVRQMCRKLDLYWDEKLFNDTMKLSATRSMMTNYISKLNNVRFAGKSYDDTLKKEGALWVWPGSSGMGTDIEEGLDSQDDTIELEDDIEISEDVVAFWGPGNTPKMYQELEQRYQYWKKHLPRGVDISAIGVQALLRQICSVEIEINKERAAGKSTDKLVNTLNTLLGSAMLKPTQKKEEDSSLEKTPLGVMAKIIEQKHPVAQVSDKFKDVDGIGRYITTWYYGHAGKMLGEKSISSKLYEEAVAKLRVEHPEFDDEDDEELIYDVFSGGEGNDQG